MSPLISIIVPVYNAEDCLENCVESILNQECQNFELLLIDDGSPDRSGEICDVYAVKDSRIRVFHKENGGVSMARNMGLEMARGEWVIFIDADDSIAPGFLNLLNDNTGYDLIIGGYKTLPKGEVFYDFDVTKLSIFTLDVGLAGIEVYDLLRDEYGIQIEFGDIGNVLAYISVGDSEANIERLVGALSEIRRRFKKDRTGMLDHEYINPEVIVSPQVAFYGEKESLPLKESANRVCSEFVMCYPPGIPILAPGEKITPEILDYIEYAKEKGCFMTGPEDMEINNLNVLKEEVK